MDSINQVVVRPQKKLVIKEGFRPLVRQEVVVEGKGKSVMKVQPDAAVFPKPKPNSLQSTCKEASSSSGLILKVNNFMGNHGEDQNQISRNLSIKFENDAKEG